MTVGSETRPRRTGRRGPQAHPADRQVLRAECSRCVMTPRLRAQAADLGPQFTRRRFVTIPRPALSSPFPASLSGGAAFKPAHPHSHQASGLQLCSSVARGIGASSPEGPAVGSGALLALELAEVRPPGPRDPDRRGVPATLLAGGRGGRAGPESGEAVLVPCGVHCIPALAPCLSASS